MADMSKDEFDLDAWIADAAPPRGRIRVCQRLDLLAELDQLKDDYQRADQYDLSLGDGDPAEVYADAVAAVRAQMEVSSLTLTLRGLNQDELAEIEAKADGVESGVRRNAVWNTEALLRSAVEPKFGTVAQASRFMGAIGNGQSAAVSIKVSELSTTTGGVDVPTLPAS